MSNDVEVAYVGVLLGQGGQLMEVGRKEAERVDLRRDMPKEITSSMVGTASKGEDVVVCMMSSSL